MASYKLPLGIRIARDDEYPEEYDKKSATDEKSLEYLIEGFNIKEVSGEKFSHYAEANIDADKIWDLFCSLTDKLIDDPAYGVLSVKDEKPVLSRFTKKEGLLDIFEEYRFELIMMGFLNLG